MYSLFSKDSELYMVKAYAQSCHQHKNLMLVVMVNQMKI